MNTTVHKHTCWLVAQPGTVPERRCTCMALPLTRTLHPDDYGELQPELEVVDREFGRVLVQHEARRWEYALALRALGSYRQGHWKRFGSRLADVGGGGSPFTFMVSNEWIPTVIDPTLLGVEHGDHARYHLETALQLNICLQDAVVCLSVLEHVDNLEQFLYHLSCLVAPGGLLFLTVDCGRNSTDTYRYHWMRKRIFSPRDWQCLSAHFPNFHLLGPVDWTYHDDQVFDYTFASLALQKKA